MAKRDLNGGGSDGIRTDTLAGPFKLIFWGAWIRSRKEMSIVGGTLSFIVSSFVGSKLG
jgi:hypothetical protein